MTALEAKGRFRNASNHIQEHLVESKPKHNGIDYIDRKACLDLISF